MLVLFTAFAAGPAQDGAVPDGATPASAPSASDDGLSPWKRYLAGSLYTGVFDVHDARVCSAKGAKAFDEHLVPRGGTVAGAENDPLLANWVGALSLWHARFVAAGDMVVSARHTCVGLIDTGGVNATSYFEGFMLFDPRAMSHTVSAPGAKFSRVEAVLAHEYAHQLQYWHGSVFAGERSDRRTELTADCMAAGMLATEGAHASGGGMVTLYAIEEGVAGAFRSLGDDRMLSDGHHGTAAEREQFARAGVRIAVEQYSVGGERWALHSGALKSRCELAVIQHDASQPLMHPSDLLQPKKTP